MSVHDDPSWRELIDAQPSFASGEIGTEIAAARAARVAEADPTAEAAAVDQSVSEYVAATNAEGLAALDAITEADAERERQRRDAEQRRHQ